MRKHAFTLTMTNPERNIRGALRFNQNPVIDSTFGILMAARHGGTVIRLLPDWSERVELNGRAAVQCAAAFILVRQ